MMGPNNISQLEVVDEGKSYSAQKTYKQLYLDPYQPSIQIG